MDEVITLAHGSGGEKSRELVEHLFLPAYSNPYLNPLTDSAILTGGEKIAMTTDSYVVKPLFFPGGDIGRLAVSGTVNDLAVSGACPKFLSVGMILAAGLEMNVLQRIVQSIAATAKEAGVQIVTGDTKVVEHNSADRIFINTTGIGVFPAGRSIPPQKIEAGDCIIASGFIASHGMAVMAERNSLGFIPAIESDVAPLGKMVGGVLQDSENVVHAMRDPTRGGVAATLCEWVTTNTDILLYDQVIPVRADVRAACKILGLDPLFIANEGVVLFAVAQSCAKNVITALQKDSHGCHAVIIGEVRKGIGKVVALTEIGSQRRILMPRGELLPRIC
ncbi:MAG TPA: hydrogenase expression/formation protein HypE [Bacillota bacterium]|nr:hydrogenase expression/formation protein HypE [Bacillota bacterium]